MRCVRALTSEQGMSERAQAHAARPVALANATQHLALAKAVRILADTSGYLASEAQEALLTQHGGHEVVLLMNSIERAMRMGSAAAEGCAIMSRLVGRPCYRADPEGEVAWWTTRLIEMQTPAEALCMWLSVPLHTEYVENAAFAEVTDAVLRDIANLRNARIPVQAACSMACRLGCILPLPLAVAFSFCARASAKPGEPLYRYHEWSSRHMAFRQDAWQQHVLGRFAWHVQRKSTFAPQFVPGRFLRGGLSGRVSEQHVRVCVPASRVAFLRGTDEQDVLTFACLLKRVVQKTHAQNKKKQPKPRSCRARRSGIAGWLLATSPAAGAVFISWHAYSAWWR